VPSPGAAEAIVTRDHGTICERSRHNQLRTVVIAEGRPVGEARIAEQLTRFCVANWSPLGQRAWSNFSER